MAQVVERLTIARPPSDVWPVLSDFGDISSWAPNVDHSCLTTAQPDGVGATRRIQAGRSALLERVIEWDPPTRLTYEIEGLPPVIRSVTNSWNLESLGSGTVVTITSSINAGPRPPQQLVARVVGRALSKASSQMLQGLNTHVMQRSGGRTAANRPAGDQATTKEVGS